MSRTVAVARVGGVRGLGFDLAGASNVAQSFVPIAASPTPPKPRI